MRMKTIGFLILLLAGFNLHAQQGNIQNLTENALKIYRTDTPRALALLEEAKDQAQSDLDNQYIHNGLGIVYRFLGEFEKARQHSIKVLGSKDPKLRASAYNNLGACNRSLGKYEEAVKFYIHALREYDQLNMEEEYATVSSNLSVVYNSLGLYEKAKSYNHSAIRTFQKIKHQKGLSEAYNNFAMILVNQDSLDQALNYFTQSLDIERELKDRKGISESLNNVGGVYYYQGKINEALAIFKEVLEIEKSIDNLGGVSSTYNNIAQLLMESHDYSLAKQYIDSAYTYSKKNKISDDYLISLENYIQYNENLEQHKNANRYYKIYKKVSDSIRQESNLRQLHETEAKFQTEKKEKEILVQRAQMAEDRLKIERKNQLILGIIGLALLGGLIGFQFYRVQKIRNKQLEKENQLKDALLEIETQNKLQEQRLRISRDLHDNIGSQLTFIISSIDNLKYIWGKESPEIAKRLEDISFFTRQTISELRDTIWAMNKDDISAGDLKIRINNFLENARSATHGIEFKFETDEQVDEEHKFSALEGINLYRVVQEAVNNAIKHAQATQIQVKINQKGKRFFIEITDNGKGIDEGDLSTGNGLHNIHKRMTEIGGGASWVSGGNGTRIKLDI